LSFCKLIIFVENIMLSQIYKYYTIRDICILEGNLEIHYNIMKAKYFYLKLDSIQPYIKDKDY